MLEVKKLDAFIFTGEVDGIKVSFKIDGCPSLDSALTKLITNLETILAQAKVAQEKGFTEGSS